MWRIHEFISVWEGCGGSMSLSQGGGRCGGSMSLSLTKDLCILVVYLYL